MRDFAKFVSKYFKGRIDLVGVEVGVFRGDNAIEIYNIIKPLLLVLVDCWNPVGLGYFDGNDKGQSEENFLTTYRAHVNNKGVVILKAWSDEAAHLLSGVRFDFGYVDGNHCYLNCKQDLVCWYPLIKEGGIFGGHDYNMKGVSMAVKEVFPEGKVSIGSGEAGVDWWVTKNG